MAISRSVPVAALAACMVLLAAGGVSPALGQATVGRTINGYTFATDVSGVLNYSPALCVVVAYTATRDPGPDYPAARQAYFASNYTAPSKGLYDIAIAQYPGESYYDLNSKYFRSSTYVHDYIVSALDGTGIFTGAIYYARAQAIRKGNQYGNIAALMFHKLSVARASVARSPFACNLKAVDEAAALYVGDDAGRQCANPGTIYALSNSRGALFNTRYQCSNVSAANTAALAAFRAAGAACRAKNLGALDAAIRQIRKQVTIAFLQATLHYATVVDRFFAAGDPVWAGEQTEAYTFFRPVEAYVAAASPAALSTLRSVIFPGTVPKNVTAYTYGAAKAAIDSVLPKLSISPAEFGALGTNSTCTP